MWQARPAMNRSFTTPRIGSVRFQPTLDVAHLGPIGGARQHYFVLCQLQRGICPLCSLLFVMLSVRVTPFSEFLACQSKLLRCGPLFSINRAPYYIVRAQAPPSA